MKYTFGFWIAIFILANLVTGFIPALALTALAIGSSVSTGLSVQDKLDGPYSKKALR